MLGFRCNPAGSIYLSVRRRQNRRHSVHDIRKKGRACLLSQTSRRPSPTKPHRNASGGIAHYGQPHETRRAGKTCRRRTYARGCGRCRFWRALDLDWRYSAGNRSDRLVPVRGAESPSCGGEWRRKGVAPGGRKEARLQRIGSKPAIRDIRTEFRSPPTRRNKPAGVRRPNSNSAAGKPAGAVMPGFVFPAPASRRMSTHSQIS